LSASWWSRSVVCTATSDSMVALIAGLLSTGAFQLFT
jgi:hypothetical protein